MSSATQIMCPPQAAQACRVAWLPAHPAEGWVSMNRYWLSLVRAAQERRVELSVESPLESGGLMSARRGRLARAWARYVSYPGMVRARVSAPVVHVLDHSYAHLLDSLPRSTRKVVTVHDLIPLLDPSGLSAGQIRRFRTIAAKLCDADCLVAVSEFTKRAIVELLDVEPGRIVVSHSGVDEAFFHPIDSIPPRVKELPQGRFVLSVGSDLARKNLQVLPGVMRALSRELPDVWLVRAGSRMSQSLAEECRAALAKGRLIELGSVSDHELNALYQRAGALLFPSTFEGWGLPVAEALAAGCPAVCSNVAGLPEAGGGVALMAAPDDELGFAACLARVIADQSSRERIVAQGRELSVSRTWLHHLDELTGIYRRLS